MVRQEEKGGDGEDAARAGVTIGKLSGTGGCDKRDLISVLVLLAGMVGRMCEVQESFLSERHPTRMT